MSAHGLLGFQVSRLAFSGEPLGSQGATLVCIGDKGLGGYKPATMRRTAIISDIHSNIAALDAVLADIAANDVEQIYCLGDVVGYGPQPVEAMSKVLDVCRPDRCIMGNHDHAVIHEPVGFNRSAVKLLCGPIRWCVLDLCICSAANAGDGTGCVISRSTSPRPG